MNNEIITGAYSEEEQFTGKLWIDGKKIYRRVVQFTTKTSVNQIATINNLDKVINISGVATKVGDNTLDLNYYYNADNFIRTWVYTNILYNEVVGYTNYIGYVILEYTKTTD